MEWDWWPGVTKDGCSNLRSCSGCHIVQGAPTYRTMLSFRLTVLFDTFSIDFAGLLSPDWWSRKRLLITVEHLTGYPITRVTDSETSEEILRLVNGTIIFSFDIQRMIISENRKCFAVIQEQKFTEENGITWKITFEYDPMSSERAKWMITSVKKYIAESDFQKRLPQTDVVKYDSFWLQK